MNDISRREFFIAGTSIVGTTLYMHFAKENPDFKQEIDLEESRQHLIDLLGPEKGNAMFERSKRSREILGDSTIQNVFRAMGEFTQSINMLKGATDKKQSVAAVEQAGKMLFLRVSDCWVTFPARRSEILKMREEILQSFAEARNLTRALPPGLQNANTSKWAEDHGVRWSALRQLMNKDAGSYKNTLTERLLRNELNQDQ